VLASFLPLINIFLTMLIGLIPVVSLTLFFKLELKLVLRSSRNGWRHGFNRVLDRGSITGRCLHASCVAHHVFSWGGGAILSRLLLLTGFTVARILPQFSLQHLKGFSTEQACTFITITSLSFIDNN